MQKNICRQLNDQGYIYDEKRSEDLEKLAFYIKCLWVQDIINDMDFGVVYGTELLHHSRLLVVYLVMILLCMQ